MIDAILSVFLHANEIVSIDSSGDEMRAGGVAMVTRMYVAMVTGMSGRSQEAGVIERRQRASKTLAAVSLAAAAAPDAPAAASRQPAAANAALGEHLRLHDRANLGEGLACDHQRNIG